MRLRRMTKIGITKDQKIHMAYEQKNLKGDYDEYTLTCADEARPEFYNRLCDLAEYVIEICELPVEYMDRIVVRSVSLTANGESEVLGAVISSQMKLNKSSCPLNLNTPHKVAEYMADSGDPDSLMPPGMEEALNYLFDEAELYINGTRAQGDLFADHPESVMNVGKAHYENQPEDVAA